MPIAITVVHDEVPVVVQVDNELLELAKELAPDQDKVLCSAEHNCESRPTLNKLYSLVRKGSMGTPAEVLQAFWQELRGRTRVT